MKTLKQVRKYNSMSKLENDEQYKICITNCNKTNKKNTLKIMKLNFYCNKPTTLATHLCSPRVKTLSLFLNSLMDFFLDKGHQ